MLLPLLVRGWRENQQPFPRAQSSCALRTAPSPAAPQLARASLRAPTLSACPAARIPAGSCGSCNWKPGWPGLPHARNLPCSLARARAVPSARHASQPKTGLPRGCPARRSGLQTRLGRFGCCCWLVAARRSRAGSCRCARGGRGRGNSWQLQLRAPELQLQPRAGPLPPSAS